MFTGLVEEVGAVRRVARSGEYQRMTVTARKVLEGTAVGDSIALDGVCQTVTRVYADSFEVETLAVSLAKTTMGQWRPGRPVNLERSLTPSSRLGGHFVQGHVDGRAPVVELRQEGQNGYLTIAVAADLAAGCVAEGSIAIDGVSLTIATLGDGGDGGARVTVNVIPHTWSATSLGGRRVGDEVNVEVDILGRYVARFLSRGGSGETTSRGGALSREALATWGYQ